MDKLPVSFREWADSSTWAVRVSRSELHSRSSSSGLNDALMTQISKLRSAFSFRTPHIWLRRLFMHPAFWPSSLQDYSWADEVHGSFHPAYACRQTLSGTRCHLSSTDSSSC